MIKRALESRKDFDILAALLLRVGKPFKGVKRLPDDLRLGEPKECFSNAGEAAMSNKRYRYVEGYAINTEIGLPFSHAWLTRPGTRVAYDVTLPDPQKYEFFGVAFKHEELRDSILETGYWGILAPLGMYRTEVFEKLCPGIVDDFKRAHEEKMKMLGELRNAMD